MNTNAERLNARIPSNDILQDAQDRQARREAFAAAMTRSAFGSRDQSLAGLYREDDGKAA